MPEGVPRNALIRTRTVPPPLGISTRRSIPLFERARASSRLSGGETRSCRVIVYSGTTARNGFAGQLAGSPVGTGVGPRRY